MASCGWMGPVINVVVGVRLVSGPAGGYTYVLMRLVTGHTGCMCGMIAGRVESVAVIIVVAGVGS
jgi:hypothetical protein